jgi:hypothetical protein
MKFKLTIYMQSNKVRENGIGLAGAYKLGVQEFDSLAALNKACAKLNDCDVQDYGFRECGLRYKIDERCSEAPADKCWIPVFLSA